MSLQVNLSSPAIRTAYEKVLDGVKDYLVLSYKKLSNDLDVTANEKGSLDDLAEEFSDGKIQYALARVVDPNTKLPKFVLINWCGEGVPENRKGLFASHSAAVADYFKVYHVSIQARSDDDIAPALILRKVTDSSGSKYGVASSRASEPIAPVGTSHKPVGTPDIRGMQAKAPKDSIAPVGTAYTPARDELQLLREGKLKNSDAPPIAPRPMPSASKVPPPRTTPAPPPSQAVPPRPSAAAPTPVEAPPKPADDDRIRPVGTAYTPVSLPRPGKLSSDRTKLFSQPSETSTPAPIRRTTPGKLTWSQRQEMARKQQEEAEQAAADADIIHTPASSSRSNEAAKVVPPPPPAPPSEPAHSVDEVVSKMQGTSLGETGGNTTSKASQGVRATVLYDYEAEEDNELTLREGDILTQVDQVDEGWWSATGPDGSVGLFPANYVELLENAATEAAAVPKAPSPPAPVPPPAAPTPAGEDVPPPPPPPPAPPAPATAEADDDTPPPPPPPPPAPPAPPAPTEAADDSAPPPPPPPPPAPPAPPAQEEVPPPPPAPPAPAPVPTPAGEEVPPPPPPPPPPATAATAAATAPHAIALYDYEIDEDNEIELVEGDRIVDIEFASDDWWSGRNERTGATGLFPAVCIAYD